MNDGTAIRPTAVAGLFYPADPSELEAGVYEMLGAESPAAADRPVRGIVAPHAGYQYSGPTAAAAFVNLTGTGIRRVAVIAPSHREFFNGVSVYPGSAYRTPLGTVPVDTNLRERLVHLCTMIAVSPAGHGKEHAIEVHLPFLQRLLPGFALLPIVIGHQTREHCFALGEALSVLMKETDLLVVASSDLSHYHPWAVAQQLDGVFIADLERGDEERLMADLESGATEACGGGPVVAMMRAVRQAGEGRFSMIRHTTSGDVTGDRTSVVGYLSAAAYA
jgi:AmmeMemoRadiSam system protein B